MGNGRGPHPPHANATDCQSVRIETQSVAMHMGKARRNKQYLWTKFRGGIRWKRKVRLLVEPFSSWPGSFSLGAIFPCAGELVRYWAAVAAHDYFRRRIVFGRRAAGHAAAGHTGQHHRGTGLLLYYQNASGDWASWAYAWSIYPGLVGVGILLMQTLSGNFRQGMRESGILFLISVVLFAVFGAFLMDWAD